MAEADAKKAEAKPEEKKEEGKSAAAAEGGAPGEAGPAEEDDKKKVVLNTKKDVPKKYLSSEIDKRELEQVRRWKVLIKEIYITPLDDPFDPFLEFTVGGDYCVREFLL